MKNKHILPIFFASFFVILICGKVNLSYAQTTEVRQHALEVRSAFLGTWKEAQDAHHILEIYKDGDLTIVYKRSEIKDGSGSKKYTVMSETGNKIMIDYGYGSTPLTISDDGTKINFAGQEYIKQ